MRGCYLQFLERVFHRLDCIIHHCSHVPIQIANLTEEKEELADELESARAQLKRKDQEIGQLRAQNEQMRAQLGGGEVGSLACCHTSE